MGLVHRERIDVHVDGEDIEVFNRVNLSIPCEVRGGTSMEQFEPEIGAGDSRRPPEYVTHWVANDLWYEHSLDVKDFGIEMIDVESDEVTVY